MYIGGKWGGGGGGGGGGISVKDIRSLFMTCFFAGSVHICLNPGCGIEYCVHV